MTEVFDGASLDRNRWQTVVEPVLGRVSLALERDRFPHALLLVGPEGLGRELAAQEIAVMLVGQEGPRSFAQSAEADRIRHGNHPDVIIVGGEGAKGLIKIEVVREIVEQAPGRPFEGKNRVWIIDGVDRRMEASAANAFLKVLEEPPQHCRFILLAANPQAVLPTIRSRCSRLMMPGIVGTADSLGAGNAPPELAVLVDRDPGVVDLFDRAKGGLRQVLEGDAQAAIRMSTVFGAAEGGLEILAAAALELASEESGWPGAQSCAALASELLASDRAIRTLGLRPERQILGSLLAYASGRGGA